MTAKVIPLRDAQARPPTSFAFSKTAIREHIALFENARDVTLRDTKLRGLVLRKQTRDWTFQVEKKVRGQKHRETIEPWTGRNDITWLREEAGKIIGEMLAGTRKTAAQRREDLFAADAADAEVARLQAMTTAEALDLHFEVNPQLRGATREVYGYSMLDLTGARSIRMTALTPQLVRERYDAILAEKSAATAARLVRTIRAVWNTWAAEHPEGQEPLRNPATALTRKRDRMAKVEPRKGSLAPEDRLRWWRHAELFETATGAALRMIFLTGMRRNEVLALTWDEVNLADSFITIGADRMKGRAELRKPITLRLRDILEAQLALRPGEHPFVFPARRGPRHVTDLRKTLRRVNDAATGNPDAITTHDLRRTFLAAGGDALIPQSGLKQLVGHSLRDITERYQVSPDARLLEFAGRIEAELLRDIR